MGRKLGSKNGDHSDLLARIQDVLRSSEGGMTVAAIAQEAGLDYKTAHRALTSAPELFHETHGPLVRHPGNPKHPWTNRRTSGFAKRWAMRKPAEAAIR